MVHGVVIPASDSAQISSRDFVGLDDYQRAVGGWIEAVDIPELGVALYVNEEGLVHGLPFNRRATFLWWFHVPGAGGNARLVGDAVVVGWPDARGESTDVPDEVRTALLTPNKYIVSVRETNDSRWHPSPIAHDDYRLFANEGVAVVRVPVGG